MQRILVFLGAVILGCGGSHGSGGSTTPATATPAAKTAAPTTNPDDDAHEGPWGPTVPSPDTEARVKVLLERMRDGKIAAGDLDNVLMFGPALWSTWQLAGMNSNEGIPIMARVKVGDRTVIGHGRVVRFDALAPFMAGDAVKMTGKYFADGEVAPANAMERHLYYIGISWEIEGKPITVVRKKDETLVVVLDDEGRLFQIDTLGPWLRLVSGGESEIEKYQPANPLPAP